MKYFCLRKNGGYEATCPELNLKVFATTAIRAMTQLKYLVRQTKK